MSGVTSSKRQWASLRVRAMTAVLLALAMLIPMVGVAMAQEEPAPAPVAADAVPYPGSNQLCISGTVINFDETRLPYGNDGNETPWTITARNLTTGEAAVSKEVDENGYFEFTGLSVGDWEVAITAQPGWEPVPPYELVNIVRLDMNAKNCAVVRFKLRYPVQVFVYKIDDNHQPLADWTIRAEPAYGNWFASPIEGVTDDSGLAVNPDEAEEGEVIDQPFRLTHGKWIFTERAPKGVHFTPVMPENGRQEIFIDASKTYTEPIILRFKNRIYDNGCIFVTKTDPVEPNNDLLTGFGLPGWKMTVKRMDGTVVATGMTDALGEVRFNKLPFGPYIVVEEQKPGWAPSEQTPATTMQVLVESAAGDENSTCARVDFVNRQSADFCIEGYKLDANGHIGLPNWTIKATPLAKGGYPDPDLDKVDSDGDGDIDNYLTAITDGTGLYRFSGFPANDYRIPGAGYRVCEERQDGWLPHTAECFTVYLPKKPGACVKVPNFVNQQVGHSEASWHRPVYPPSGGCASTHTVVAGESLFGIGNRYGVSGSAMLAANPWVNNRHNRYVFPGDLVCIP